MLISWCHGQLSAPPQSSANDSLDSFASLPARPSDADAEMKSIRLASQFSSITRRWLYTLWLSRMTRPVCSMLLWPASILRVLRAPFSVLRAPFSWRLSFHSLFKCCIKCHSWVSPLSREAGRDRDTGGDRSRSRSWDNDRTQTKIGLRSASFQIGLTCRALRWHQVEHILSAKWLIWNIPSSSSLLVIVAT